MSDPFTVLTLQILFVLLALSMSPWQYLTPLLLMTVQICEGKAKSTLNV